MIQWFIRNNLWFYWTENEPFSFEAKCIFLIFKFPNEYASLQAYHSQISKADDHLSSFALLPIRTQTRGPAPISNGEDIIDETIYYFKANIFFRTYEIKVGWTVFLRQNSSLEVQWPAGWDFYCPKYWTYSNFAHFQIYNKKFPIFQSGIDRLLIYITLYITECLKKLQKCANKAQAQQDLYSLAIARFDIPGDAGFPLNSVYPKPSSPNEAGKWNLFSPPLIKCGRIHNVTLKF